MIFKSKKQKILFINDTSDDNNLGCKATTKALYALIDKHLRNFEISGVIKLFHTEREAIKGTIPLQFFDFDLLAQNVFKLENDIFAFEVNKMNRCDVVLINGEGSIYKDVTKCRYLLFLAYLAKKYFHKSVYLVNHTADVSSIQEIAKEVYSILDGVVVRESFSKKELEHLGVKNVLVSPDAIFALTIKDNKFYDRLPVGFDLNKDFIMLGGSSLNNPVYEQWYGRADLSSFYRLAQLLRKQFDVQIFFADVGGDDFLRNFDMADGMFYGKLNYKDYFLLSSKALMHLSGRHHGTCLAAMSGCPVLGISANTHKMQGDFELLEWRYPIYDFYNLDANIHDITKNIHHILNDRKNLKRFLLKQCSKCKNLAKLNVTILKK